jgi:hypothetical protein
MNVAFLQSVEQAKRIGCWSDSPFRQKKGYERERKPVNAFSA